MSDEQENKGTQPDSDQALKDDVKMSILASVEAARGKRPGSGSVLEPEKLDPGRSEGPLDINRAAEQQLAKIPGIGPALASAIVRYRQDVSPFQETSDLTAVPGMSRKAYDRVADLVTVEPVEPEQPYITGYDERPAGEDKPWDASQGPGPG